MLKINFFQAQVAALEKHEQRVALKQFNKNVFPVR